MMYFLMLPTDFIRVYTLNKETQYYDVCDNVGEPLFRSAFHSTDDLATKDFYVCKIEAESVEDAIAKGKIKYPEYFI